MPTGARTKKKPTGSKALEAQLDKSGHLGQRRRALCARHGQHFDLSRLLQGGQRGGVQPGCLDLPANQFLHQGRSPFVRGVHQVDLRYCSVR